MNRRFSLTIIFIMLTASAFAQKTIDTFFEKYGTNDNVELYDMLKMISSQAADTLSPEKKAIIKKLNKFQVMTVQINDNNKDTTTNDIAKLKADLLKDKYEELTSLKSGDSKSVTMVCTNNDNKAEKDYVQIIEENDGTLIIHIAGEMTDNEFSTLISSVSVN